MISPYLEFELLSLSNFAILSVVISPFGHFFFLPQPIDIAPHCLGGGAEQESVLKESCLFLELLISIVKIALTYMVW